MTRARQRSWRRIVVMAPASIVVLLSLSLLIHGVSRDAESLPHELSTRLVDLNTADESDLRFLPGIGPAMAARILSDRLENGPYRDLNDLTRVRGIGERTIINIAPYVSITDPDAALRLDSPPDNGNGAAAGRE